MLRVLVKVSVVVITELIPGPLLGVERDTLATLDLFLDSIVRILLLLQLKVPVRAGATGGRRGRGNAGAGRPAGRPGLPGHAGLSDHHSC